MPEIFVRRSMTDLIFTLIHCTTLWSHPRHFGKKQSALRSAHFLPASSLVRLLSLPWRRARISTLNCGYVTASVPLNEIRSAFQFNHIKCPRTRGSLSTHLVSLSLSFFLFRNGSPLRFSWCRANARNGLHRHRRRPRWQHVHGRVSLEPTGTCHCALGF